MGAQTLHRNNAQAWPATGALGVEVQPQSTE